MEVKMTKLIFTAEKGHTSCYNCPQEVELKLIKK